MMFSRKWRVLVATATLLIAPACSLTKIAAYDETLDVRATELQFSMDSALSDLATRKPQPRFNAMLPFYEQYALRLRAVEIRSASLPDNSLTTKQLGLLQRSLADLISTHRSGDGALNEATITTLRDLFNSHWRSILTLELAKRR